MLRDSGLTTSAESPKRFGVLVFDLDGTLLDTLSDIATSSNRVLAARGFPTHAVETYRPLIGDGPEDCLRRALPEHHRSDAMVLECLAAYRAEYARNWNRATRPYEGIPALLATVVARGAEMAVLSNKLQRDTERCLEAFFPGSRFAPVLGQDGRRRRKPDPSGALEIAQGLGVAPEDCLLVGDTEIDMATARAAGMFPLGVLWGYRAAADLTRAGAERLVREPAEILELVRAR